MRVIIILVLLVIALAMLRMLVSEVSRAAIKAWNKSDGEGRREAAGGDGRRLVQDPETGAYVAEDAAIRATVDGITFYFESNESRERFLRRRAEEGVGGG